MRSVLSRRPLLPLPAWRHARPRFDFGRMLAAVALLLQSAAPSLHAPVLPDPANEAAGLSGVFGDHVLCLARDSADVEKSPDRGSKPVHHEFAACCFWHAGGGLAVEPVRTPERVLFARSRVVLAPPRQVPRGRLTGTVGARAPPERA